MTLQRMEELFGVTHVGEEEVSLSQPIIVVAPPEEEEVPVMQGPAVAVPAQEEDVPVPL
jgi:hypothetical protein